MKKITLALLVAVLTAGSAMAQLSFGLRAGINQSDIFTGGDKPYDNQAIFKKFGFQIGGVAEYAIDDNWSIQPSVILTTQGSRLRVNTGEQLIALLPITKAKIKGKSSVSLTYIQIPVNVQYKIGDLMGGGMWIKTGPYFGYAIGGKLKYDMTITYSGYGSSKPYTESEKYEKELTFGNGADYNYKQTDFGWYIGIDAGDNKSRLGVGINFGLKNISNVSTARNFCIPVTFTYMFGKKE